LPTIVDVYRQHGIPHEVTARGWVNCRCPYCGGDGQKMGFGPSSPHFFCWKCGSHPGRETLSRLLGVAEDAAASIWHSLGQRGPDPVLRDRSAQQRVRTSSYHRPSGVVPLTASHSAYLERRGFDPDRVRHEWGVCSTGPVSRVGSVDYRNRLFIPISWDGREVSFQTRDTTGKSDAKYKSCPEERELAHHKHVLYGSEEAWRGGIGVAVEGVTDVWRLGSIAFAVFGIQYRPEQVLEAARHFDRVAVAFDGERQAQVQARKLAAQLAGMGVRTTVLRLGEGVDPGGMSDDDAAHLAAEVRRWGG